MARIFLDFRYLSVLAIGWLLCVAAIVAVAVIFFCAS
jgi:hypothetical protein